ncbi:MAG: hypothetical protein GC186_04930 [Rhodobacteraceae bacterium]|nr:hypothetical protein [Paracoccaceae bacterium]
MDLELDDTRRANVGAADLAAAFAKPRSAHNLRSITLWAGDDGYLQAFANPGEDYMLTSRDGGQQVDGLRLLPAADAEKVLASYLAGGPDWRAAMDWSDGAVTTVATTATPGGGRSRLIGVAAIIVVAVLVILIYH